MLPTAGVRPNLGDILLQMGTFSAKLRAVVAFLLLYGPLLAGETSRDSPSFGRDIRPILAAKCYSCHGPDTEKREAELRLDLRSDAVKSEAIVPGKPELSELVRRIQTVDLDERMPPPEGGEALTNAQQQLIRHWIAGGAPFETHWAYIPPIAAARPPVHNASWPRNAIDYFILAGLESRQTSPSEPADRYKLVRRIYFDLIGMPPTPAEADDFVDDQEPRAYERLVDRLLNSRHYGERWAQPWLDLARYADTNGYEKDRPRSIWAYRDWVIRSLNADMPFDQFTVEQLAGDMLPNATAQQRVATGFHRNTMLNEEGGIDPLEYRFYSMVDRVATTGTVWMGLTVGCAQCHTHKYDPITHVDYYRLMALLNNTEEPEFALDFEPFASQRAQLDREIAALEANLPEQLPAGIEEQERANDSSSSESPSVRFEKKFQHWVAEHERTAVEWSTIRPTEMKSNLPKLTLLEDGSILSTGDITKRDVFEFAFRIEVGGGPVSAIRLEAIADPSLPAGGPGRCYYEGRKGDFFLSELTATYAGRRARFHSASHSYGKLTIGSGNAMAMNVLDGDGSTGWSTAEREGESHYLLLNLSEPIVADGELHITLTFERHFAASLGRLRWSVAAVNHELFARDLPVEIEALLAGPSSRRTREDWAELRMCYARTAPELAKAREPIDRLRGQRSSLPATLVMSERDDGIRRPTFRHHRGEYLSPREQVEPGVLQALRGNGLVQPTDRLSFANWLVSDANPLVGRVAVNRAWQSFFGVGLVRTAGDFGTQGEFPSHPELLDWLAKDFMEHGWSMKRLHRLIVTSATYLQDSDVAANAGELDPENRLLSRFPRQRLDAEVVRDAMLRSSGLLSDKMFGPGVFPPQPASVAELAYGDSAWTPSEGEDRFRRSLYTFRKRTAPFAAFAVFDAPTGELCVARRERSNTPLQALTLLNDEMYLEMARALARASIQQRTPREVANELFRRVLIRPPNEGELNKMLAYQSAQCSRCRAGELNSVAIAGSPQATPDQAAWVMLSRAIMNLDEAITKP